MDNKYIIQRAQELLNYIKQIISSSEVSNKRANEIIEKVKTTSEENEKLELLKEFKKIQFFDNLKLTEIERFFPILLELHSVSKVINLELNLSEEDENFIEVNKHRFQPLYTFDKNELRLINPKLEEIINSELNSPAKSDFEAIKNITKALS